MGFEVEKCVLAKPLSDRCQGELDGLLSVSTRVDEIDVEEASIAQQYWQALRVSFRVSRLRQLEFPVRRTACRDGQIDVHIGDLDRFDDDRWAEERCEVDLYFGPADRHHVLRRCSFCIGKADVPANHDDAPGDVDRQVPNAELAAGFLADPALDLRFEYAQVGGPQPACPQDQDPEDDEQRPEADLAPTHASLFVFPDHSRR